MTTTVETRYPIGRGSPVATCRPWAMIAPSSAKKMHVNSAKITVVIDDP